jgi:hypothetical protein
MASKQARRTLYRATVAKDLPLVRELIVQPELRGISGRMKSLHRAVKDDQLEIVQALVSDQPITEEEERGDDDTYTLSNLYHSILVKSLAKSNPGFWVAVRPYVIGSLDTADLETCSIQMLRYLHDNNLITNYGWISALQGCSEMTRFQAMWQIRSPNVAEPTLFDCRLIRRLIIAMTECQDLVAHAIEKMTYLLERYPGAIHCRENAFLEMAFTGNNAINSGNHPEVMTMVLENDAFDPNQWLIDALPQIIEDGSWMICSELISNKTKSCHTRYLYDPRAKIGLLVSRDPPTQQVCGWTSFLIAGHYFYSPNIYLDTLACKLTAGFDYGLVFPDDERGELVYPEQEQLIEIAYGLDYGELITIPAPSFLLDWYRDSGVGTKGARS